MRCLIIDDAPQARELLKLMLQDIAQDIEVVGESDNAEDARKLIISSNPHVVFLDIEMPGKSGIQLLEELSKEDINFEIVFVTAYHQYAIQAFRLSAMDYLLKPVRAQELKEALNKIREQLMLKKSSERLKVLVDNLSVKENNTLCIPVNYGYDYIPISDIEFIEADRSYSIIHLSGGMEKLISKPLGYFEDILQSLSSFIKTHRSYYINLNFIVSYTKKSEGGLIFFKSGKKAEVSRNYRKTFLEKIEQKH
ncbi:MAG TPA: LytTR family DNA-binding domain-containing protein [Cytophagaceae bacterium]